MSNKVISLSEKIEERKKQEEYINQERDKLLKNKKTIKIRPYEVFVLLDCWTCFLAYIQELIVNSLDKNSEEYEDKIIDCKIQTKVILDLIKRLYPKFTKSNCIDDIEIKMLPREIHWTLEIIESCISILPKRKKSTNGIYYPLNYDEKNYEEKTLLYLYAIFSDLNCEIEDKFVSIKIPERNKCKQINQDSSSSKYLEKQINAYDNIVKYYKDCYIKEYLCKTLIAYEGMFSRDNNTLWYSFFIKPNKKINRILSKYKSKLKDYPYFDYISKDKLKEYKNSNNFDSNLKNNFNYKEGWRVYIKILSYEEYKEKLSKHLTENNISISYEENNMLFCAEELNSIAELSHLEKEILFLDDITNLKEQHKVGTKYLINFLNSIANDYENNEELGLDGKKLAHKIHKIINK